MKRFFIILPFLAFSAFSYDAFDIKEAIAEQDMQEVKNIVQKIIPKIEEMHDEALEQVKSLTGDLINADLIPDLKKIDSFEIRQKLEELDFDVIKGELEFLADNEILTNLVNLMDKHWNQVYMAASEILGWENLNEVEIVDRKKRSASTTSTPNHYFRTLILLIIICQNIRE